MKEIKDKLVKMIAEANEAYGEPFLTESEQSYRQGVVDGLEEGLNEVVKLITKIETLEEAVNYLKSPEATKYAEALKIVVDHASEFIRQRTYSE